MRIRLGRSRYHYAGGALLAACVLLAAGCGSSSSSSTAKKASKTGTLQVWLGGDFTSATPGSGFRKWVNGAIDRFQAQNPGWKVQVTLLPVENAQLAAKVEAAFSSGNVPDVMNLYTGGYTTAYEQVLMPLNKYVNSTPGLYDSIPEAVWNISCAGFKCEGGKAKILGIPTNAGSYYLFYNKALLHKAGISNPPTTYTEWYADCATLNSKGIEPVAYGDREGYDTSNVFTTNLVSTLGVGDLQKLLNGEMKYTSPEVVSALEAVVNLAAGKKNCTTPDALTTEQLAGTKDFTSGKAAMAPFYGLLAAEFRKALGNNLGVAKQPLSGHGPLLKIGNGYAGNPFDNWVIPDKAKNAEMAWKFIVQASGEASGDGVLEDIGYTPANKNSIAKITDPVNKFMAKLDSDPTIPELDQVQKNSVAIYMYTQLSLAFKGKETAEQAMSNLQQYAEAHAASAG